MQTAPNIVHGDWKTYQHEAERVRAMVFIAEQKVPRELEFDEDDKTAEHFIAFDARHMVTGCAGCSTTAASAASRCSVPSAAAASARP